MSALKRFLRLREVVMDATSNVITFLDYDNRFHPDRLRVVSRILEKYLAITTSSLDLVCVEYAVPIKHVLNATTASYGRASLRSMPPSPFSLVSLPFAFTVVGY